MYINYKLLYEQGLDDNDYHNLQKIFQKEDFFLALHCSDRELDKYETMNLIQYTKSGKDRLDRVRISKKGKSFLTNLEVMDYTESIAACVSSVVNLYEASEKHVGNKLEVQNRMTWFTSQTGFNGVTRDGI